MTKITFRFWVEVKNEFTGISTWNSDGISPEVLIESVSVTTDAELNKVEEMINPIIIPLGCKQRTATISGVFSDSLNLNNYANSKLDVVQGTVEPLSRAISIASGSNLIPELGDHKWRINNFTWDRTANKLGQYHFTLQLGYIWVASENEIQLFSSGVGTKKYDNVKFYYTTTNVFSQDHPIYNTTIHATCKELNTAEFSTINKELSENSIIWIYSGTYTTKPMFYGIVKEVKNSANGTFKYSCIEIGDILNRKQCAKIGTGLFKPRIKIPNPYGKVYFTVAQMVKIIMSFYYKGILYNYSPGYGTCTSPTLAAKNTLPGKGTYLAPQILSGMSVGKALDTLLVNQCGFYTWYDSLTGALTYGFVRNAITLDPESEYIQDTVKIDSNISDYTFDYVLLWGNTSNNYAFYPDSAITASAKCIQYKLNSDLLTDQLKDFAYRIYTDMKVDRSSYKVTFQAGTCRFQEGDFFTGMGDETISTPMAYRSGNDTEPETNPSDAVWQIKEMTITEQKTEVIVGSSYFNIFDIYQSTLSRCDGVPAPTETKSIEGYPAGIGASGVTTS